MPREKPLTLHRTASHAGFLRFENLDNHPEPKELEICYIASDDDALQYPFPGYPDVSVIQEPSLITLPDGRLFCAMRSSGGHPVYSLSAEEGITWSRPEPLRGRDDGEILTHPLSPCPIYDTSHGKGRVDMAMYSSMTLEGENAIIWYPERKYFLLGKRITRETINSMTIPES